MAMVNVGHVAAYTGGLNAQVGWLGRRVGGRPTRWPTFVKMNRVNSRSGYRSRWQHHKHCLWLLLLLWDQSSWHRWAATASTACVTRLGVVADWWRSWPMANALHASGGHFEQTLWLSICFLCTWWTLCFTPCLMQRVIFKECIIKVWNVMFSFALGSVSTLFRWGGHFCRVCVRQFVLLTTVQKL